MNWLDNLKLGYGGTKTEMERLLKTANEINKQHGIMSDYSIENFSDIVSAIHTVQSEMGIAGTTMKEAGSTISGSINMVKAAWQDMLVAITNPEGQTQTFGGRGQFIQDEFASIQKASETSVKSATARLVESVKTMFENVMPAVHQFVSGFGEFLAEIAPTIGEELPKLVAEFLPKFIEAGKNLITGLGSGIAQAAQDIPWPTWDDVKDVASSAWEGIKSGALSLAGLVFGKKEDGTVDWPTWEDVSELGKAAWKTITDGALGLAGLIFGKKEDGTVDWPTWETVQAKATEIWQDIKDGVKQFGGLVFGTKEDGSVDWPTWDSIKSSFDTWWEGTFLPGAQSAMNWTLKLFGMPDATAESITSLITGWWDGVKSVVESAIDWALGVPGAPHATGQQIHDLIAGWWNGIKNVALSAINWLFPSASGMDDVDGAGTKGIITSWWETSIKPFLGDILNFVLGLFGLPDSQAMVKKIQEWWAGVLKSVGTLVLNIRAIITNGNIQGYNGASQSTADQLEANGFSTDAYNASDLQTRLMMNKFLENSPYAHHAKGSWAVPYDNYPALLHRNEMVLTASQANKLRNGGMNNFDSAAIAEAVRGAVMDLTMELNNETVGRVFGNATTRRVRNNISQINRRHQYGYGG